MTESRVVGTLPANVWLASFPKSGNTWFRYVWEIAYGMTESSGLADLSEPGTKPNDSAQPCQMQYLTAWGIDARRMSCDELDLVRSSHELASGDRDGRPALRKTHEKYRRAPDGSELFPAASTRAAIVIVRDPRDVACSAARHFSLSLDDAVDMLCRRDPSSPGFPATLTSRQPQGSWSEHLDSWRRLPAFPVAVFRYEDFLDEPRSTFHAALTFGGLDLTSAEVERAVELTAFDRLAARELAAGFTERAANSSVPFFRKGKAGGWREELSEEQVRKIERNNGALMAEYGYELMGRPERMQVGGHLLKQQAPSSGPWLFSAEPEKAQVRLSLETQLTRHPQVLSAQIADDLVLVTADSQLLGLDYMGAVVWDVLSEPMTCRVLVDTLCNRFGIDEVTCLDDITPMLELLLRGGAFAKDERAG